MLNDRWPWWKIILQLGHSGDRVLPQSLLVFRQVILLDFLPVKWDKSSLIAKVGFSFLFFSFSTSLHFRWIWIYSLRKKKKTNACSRSTQTDLIEKILRIAKSSTSFHREEKRTDKVTHRWSLTESCEDFFSGQLEPGWEMSSPEPFWAQLQPPLMQGVLTAHTASPADLGCLQLESWRAMAFQSCISVDCHCHHKHNKHQIS